MESKLHPLVSLAKQTVENHVKNQKDIGLSAKIYSKYLNRKAGTFVTINKDGKLRGCIGTYLPTKENIIKEIISNAINAAAKDPRFPPIIQEELSHLSYQIYILNEPQIIKDISELDPQKYGIIVYGARSKQTGLLLPSLEGINEIEQQLSIACQKAGINPAKEKLTIVKFTTEKY